MNKKFKNILALALGSFGLLLGLSACNTKAGNGAAAPTATGEAGSTLRVAYVNMDSLTNNYQYAKDIQEKLEKDAADAQKQLQSKGNAFQRAAEDFQRKVKINAFVSQEAAEKEQARVLRLQQEAAQLEATLSQQMAQKQALMMQDMLKEIQEKIAEYNKDLKYDLILTDANLLYKEPQLDITAGLIEYLNKNYKKENVDEVAAAKDSVK